MNSKPQILSRSNLSETEDQGLPSCGQKAIVLSDFWLVLNGGCKYN